MTDTTDWHHLVPLLAIPRHPLWIAAYEGAWQLWFEQAAAISPANPDACAFVLAARYAHDRRAVAGALAPFHGVETVSPLLACAEWEFYRLSGDRARLAQIFPSLVAQYAHWQALRRRASGLYWDSAPDPTSPREAYEWLDRSAQAALAAECLAHIAHALNDDEQAQRFRAAWRTLCDLINRLCWDDSAGFYLDRRADGSLSPAMTAAGFWPLLAGVPDAARAERIAAHLQNPAEFWRVHAFPCLSADHPRYSERGAYWRGSVWPLANYTVIKGLERYGLTDLAWRAADNHVTTISHVYKETRSHWENYMPDYIEPGSIARPDFAASAGLGSVALLLETILGLYADAPARSLRWTPRFRETHSIRQLRVGDINVSLSVVKSDALDTFEATLSVSSPLTLDLVQPEGVQRLEVRDAIRLRV